MKMSLSLMAVVSLFQASSAFASCDGRGFHQMCADMVIRPKSMRLVMIVEPSIYIAGKARKFYAGTTAEDLHFGSAREVAQGICKRAGYLEAIDAPERDIDGVFASDRVVLNWNGEVQGLKSTVSDVMKKCVPWQGCDTTTHITFVTCGY